MYDLNDSYRKDKRATSFGFGNKIKLESNCLVIRIKSTTKYIQN